MVDNPSETYLFGKHLQMPAEDPDYYDSDSDRYHVKSGNKRIYSPFSFSRE